MYMKLVSVEASQTNELYTGSINIYHICNLMMLFSESLEEVIHHKCQYLGLQTVAVAADWMSFQREPLLSLL